MDCFPDFCLACDNQATDGFYCSQACRLVDLERAGSTSQSPVTSPSYFSSSSWNRAHFVAHSNVHDDPSPDYYSRPTSVQQHSTSPSTTFNDMTKSSRTRYRTTLHSSTPFQILSPSSSRSSLASHRQSSDGLSEQARNELQGYFDSFDRTREQRRQSHPTINPQTSHSSTSDKHAEVYDHRHGG